jgi:hypothetical protein
MLRFWKKQMDDVYPTTQTDKGDITNVPNK